MYWLGGMQKYLTLQDYWQRITRNTAKKLKILIKLYTNICDSKGRIALVSRTSYHRNIHMGDNGEFRHMKDELLRDQLTVGILDHTTSEYLQMKPGLHTG